MKNETDKQNYYWMLDTMPAIALGQLFSKWFLSLFKGAPEASSWASAILMLFGGSIGFVICYYLRKQITRNINNRLTYFFVSLLTAIVLTLIIMTLTIFITRTNYSNPFDDPNLGSDLVQNNLSANFQTTKLLAEKGDANMQGSLGALYATGQGVTQNAQEALKWFHLSAAQNNPGGQLNLGVSYLNGSGVIQNYQEALKWFNLSAEQGTYMAQSYLGNMYGFGLGTPQDYSKALMWYLIAQANGSTTDNKNIQKLEAYLGSEKTTEAQNAAQKWWALHHSTSQ